MDNRVYVFRAWDKIKGKMVESKNIAWIDFELGKLLARSDDGIEDYYPFQKDEFELMQFTGLTDKNGKEIYEGDVLQFYLYKRHTISSNISKESGWEKYEFGWRKRCLNIVEYRIERAGFYSFGWHAYDITKLDEPEIVGNVFENPELLEKAGE